MNWIKDRKAHMKQLGEKECGIDLHSLFYQRIREGIRPPYWMKVAYHDFSSRERVFVAFPFNFLVQFVWWMNLQWCIFRGAPTWLDKAIGYRMSFLMDEASCAQRLRLDNDLLRSAASFYTWNKIDKDKQETLPAFDEVVWLYDAIRNIGPWIGGRSEDPDGWLWHNSNGDIWFADGKWYGEAEQEDYSPTHWMKLPLPPKK